MYTPVITDTSKKFGNNRWLAYSNKLKRTVYLFSDLEYEHWLHLEFNSNVKNFCEQPLRVSFIAEKKQLSSIFDMWIQYEDGYEEFIEIKYTSDLSKEKVIKQINIQKRWCESNLKNHRIVTEQEIKQSSIKLSNMKLIINMIKTPIEDLVVLEKIKKVISVASQKMTIDQLSYHSKISNSQTLIVIAHLIYLNEIRSNYNLMPFGKKTEVWL
ncbi:TnsA endonuclease N-terminal domain-containing protein [Solibacillus sp. NPDC093137]|uniref:TnsA endonuclease N-terminal domain-containing protein n=1 Tax=Solibacillus sp. NPDC093137 TaxID=3390678 RepID=UPI003D005CA8